MNEYELDPWFFWGQTVYIKCESYVIPWLTTFLGLMVKLMLMLTGLELLILFVRLCI